MIAAVMADDFTGANDCAGSFAEHGFKAYSARGDFFPENAPEVYVRSLETRFVSGDEARRASRNAWHSLSGRGRLFNYQRVDSTLRGNAPEEITGLLEATGAKRVAFCAAFPLHGRQIRGGIVSVRGQRLDQSEYASDPLSPSRHFRPQRLFAPGLAAEIGRGSLIRLRARIRASQARVLCFDAVNDADLRLLAKACLAEGVRAFAGSSGLSLALAAELSPKRRPRGAALPSARGALVGSVSQTTLDQLQVMEKAAAAPWLDLESGQRLKSVGVLKRFALSSLRDRGQMTRYPSLKGRREFAGRRMRELATKGLRLGGGPEKRLWLLTGGHCAEVFFETLKLRGSWVRGMLLPGLPLLEAAAPGGVKIFAASKPGGFGKSDVIEKFMSLRSWK